jgi:hypothetical protein
VTRAVLVLRQPRVAQRHDARVGAPVSREHRGPGSHKRFADLVVGGIEPRRQHDDPSEAQLGDSEDVREQLIAAPAPALAAA